MSGGVSHRAVLLDTCAVIWLANGDRLSGAQWPRLLKPDYLGGILVSPLSAWEVGMLSLPGSQRQPLQFLPDPKTWFARFMTGPGIKEAPLTSAIAIVMPLWSRADQLGTD